MESLIPLRNVQKIFQFTLYLNFTEISVILKLWLVRLDEPNRVLEVKDGRENKSPNYWNLL